MAANATAKPPWLKQIAPSKGPYSLIQLAIFFKNTVGSKSEVLSVSRVQQKLSENSGVAVVNSVRSGDRHFCGPSG